MGLVLMHTIIDLLRGRIQIIGADSGPGGIRDVWWSLAIQNTGSGHPVLQNQLQPRRASNGRWIRTAVDR